jgi:hypothetical protein
MSVPMHIRKPRRDTYLGIWVEAAPVLAPLGGGALELDSEPSKLGISFSPSTSTTAMPL